MTDDNILDCMSIFAVAVIVGCLILGGTARGADYGQPEMGEYYSSLMQPDNPTASCCGAGDAYFAEKTDLCSPQDGEQCALVAIITDTRPNHMVLADGREIDRAPIPVGTRIAIPRHKIRSAAIFNPTERNIVFLSQFKTVYCWEPVALI